MKLLVDANLSPRVPALLRAAGYQAEHVCDHDLLAASDEEISGFAVIHGFTIISADSDFTTMLALSGATAPSLVLLRSADRLAPEAQARLLTTNLDAVADELDQGAVVTIARGHMRVRRLPVK